MLGGSKKIIYRRENPQKIKNNCKRRWVLPGGGEGEKYKSGLAFKKRLTSKKLKKSEINPPKKKKPHYPEKKNREDAVHKTHTKRGGW